MTRRASALVVALLVLVAACGIPEESEPRAVSPERVPERLLPGVTTPPVQTSAASGIQYPIYMLTIDPDDESVHLYAFPVEFEGEATPRALVQRLLQSGAADARSFPPGVTNAIPEAVEIVPSVEAGFEIVGDEGTGARITLNDAIGSVEDQRFFRAIAQIVFTATQVGGIEQVQFLDEEGEPIQVPTDQGSDDVVTRDDYDSLRP